MDVAKLSTEDIGFCKRGTLGLITLRRVDALNAISFSMAQHLIMALQYFEADPQIKVVLLEGEGRAFSVGGDIVSLYNWTKNPTSKNKIDPKLYFNQEYDLSAYIKNYKKPYISYLDGFVMGGGAGLSMHGAYRIATNNTIFAMPEATIGFFTDVAAKIFLNHLPLPLILYICLVGPRLRWGDCLHLKLATHAFDTSYYTAFKEDLSKVSCVETLLNHYSLDKSKIASETSSEQYNLIENAFSGFCLEDCVAKLSEQGQQLLLDKLASVSPISLKIIFYYMTYYSTEMYNFSDIIEIEKKLALSMLEKGDFYEGVRALLIDKDHQPHWKFRRINEISQSFVKSFFPL